ncbi:hypothetical protein [Enterococcus hirae]|uniref:hypothetical protein n=1 Tax=Enterococcus hirae TaxID=1354 RepID=UPI00137677DF|nr:hypothetical protein [Enterococcus hirae]NBA40373.1 hypothetical protein [Enterococcus hirae]NBA56570.1 hypothetical protein [Enterococcus hirae]
MSTMGEVYFLKQIEDLKKGTTKYFFLDQEDYECWLDKIEQHNLLVVKKYTSSNYRIYLNNEKNREIVQKILKENQINKRKERKEVIIYLVAISLAILSIIVALCLLFIRFISVEDY